MRIWAWAFHIDEFVLAIENEMDFIWFATRSLDRGMDMIVGIQNDTDFAAIEVVLSPLEDLGSECWEINWI